MPRKVRTLVPDYYNLKIKNKSGRLLFKIEDRFIDEPLFNELQKEFENECWITVEKVYETRWDCRSRPV